MITPLASLALARRAMPLLLAAVASLGNATANEEPIVVAGMGTVSCGKLLEHVRPGEAYGQTPLTVAAFSWVQGYMSALNIVGIAQAGVFADLRTISEDEQWANIIDFCQRNADRFVIDAAQQIMKTRLKTEAALPRPK